MQIKTKMRYHLISVKMAPVKETENKCWKEVEKLEPKNGNSPCGKQY